MFFMLKRWIYPDYHFRISVALTLCNLIKFVSCKILQFVILWKIIKNLEFQIFFLEETHTDICEYNEFENTYIYNDFHTRKQK